MTEVTAMLYIAGALMMGLGALGAAIGIFGRPCWASDPCECPQ